MNRQVMDWEKTFTLHKSDQGFIFRTYIMENSFLKELKNWIVSSQKNIYEYKLVNA